MADTPESSAPDEAALRDLTGRVLGDAGGAVAVHLALIGDRLGLFTALAACAPANAGQLAAHTGLAERYVRDWLLAMAAAGYVTYTDAGCGPDAKRDARYRLSPEQTEAFTDGRSTHYVAGMIQTVTAATRMADRLTEAFRTGEGFAWGEQHEDMFEGTERFFRPGYLAHLTSSWIPSLTGAEERLADGARVADVGCGYGTSTIIMAEAYPNTTFVGADSPAPSIEAARARAAAAQVTERVSFRVTGAAGLDGSYDLITFFDCLHDMADPVAALRTARRTLASDGRVMAVEPMSWDTVEETLTPVGGLLAGSEMFVCLPNGLADPPAYGLGSQAGPARFLQLAAEAGFGDARVATSTEFNLVYELTP
jgi:SAM-dependent methyltransferase